MKTRHQAGRHRAPGAGFRRGERGQVMIFIVVLLFAFLLMAFFLLDLQNVIRLRSKSQTGADAAALTAAAWQGRTLNMIGELNLLKASAAMVDGVPPQGDMATSAALITHMQVRLSYVGPLLGFAASQQSAKNNGMRNNDTFAWSINYHANNWLSQANGDLYRNIYGDDPLGVGYAWVPSYERMLVDIVSRGIAARPANSRYLFGFPQLNGPGGGMLADPDFYRAVYSRNYCYFYRRGIGPDHPPIDPFAITFDLSPDPWFPGSEYLPLYVRFQVEELATSEQLATLEPLLADRGLMPIPPELRDETRFHWAVYDQIGDGYGWEQTSLYDLVTPYLDRNIKQEFTYGGPGARMMTASRPSLLTGRWDWEYGSEETDQQRLGQELDWSDQPVGGTSSGERARRLRQAEARLASLRQEEMVNSVASAKPFGSVNGVAPHRLGIVLPVFSEVRLIPVALLRENLVDADPAFFQFLVEYFGHPTFPDVPEELQQRFRQYLDAIAIYNDPESTFSLRWWDFDAWRDEYMAGEDGEIGTDDDRDDPCRLPRGGGGPGGRPGGPGIIH